MDHSQSAEFRTCLLPESHPSQSKRKGIDRVSVGSSVADRRLKSRRGDTNVRLTTPENSVCHFEEDYLSSISNVAGCQFLSIELSFRWDKVNWKQQNRSEQKCAYLITFFAT